MADSATPIAPPSGGADYVLGKATLMATVREMRKREMPVEMAETMGGFNPMAGFTPETMRRQWGVGLLGLPSLDAAFLRCRELYVTNDFVGALVDTKRDLCNDGLRINGINPSEPFAADGQDSPAETAMRQWLAESGYDFGKLARDIFLERILCDNAVLFWRVVDQSVLPKVTVLNCEHVHELRNAWGREWIIIQMPAVPMRQEEREMLGPRYADAMSGKELLVINGQQDEFYRYISGAKNGGGLRVPSLYQIFLDLGIRDSLRMGDWNGAWLMRSVIRLVRRGHEIKQGPLAGQDIHFLKAKQAKKMRTGLMQNVGAFDMVTNFDVSVSFAYLDPKFFDQAKSMGVRSRLGDWVGPLLDLMAGSVPNPDGLRLVRTRIEALREEVRRLLNGLLNDPEFLQEQKPPAPIQVTWSGDTFVNEKMLLERSRLAQASALASVRTVRESMGLNHAQEGERLKAEHADPETVTPAFEQKQGYGKPKPGGGRPANDDLPPA